MEEVELPEFTFPEGDERFISGPNGVARNYSPPKQEAIRFMYSEIESSCGSSLEGLMAVALCTSFYNEGLEPTKIREVLFPQYSIGWCKLDFLIRPFRSFPQFGYGVECDGERWHMNKEKDMRRDKWILSRGVSGIYRFTGREIEADARFCAMQVFESLKTVDGFAPKGKFFQ